jgi:hypothetical protein
MKQMRLITNASFTRGELESFRQLVFTNLVTGMKAVIECLSEVGLDVSSDPEASNAYQASPLSYLLDIVLSLYSSEVPFTNVPPESLAFLAFLRKPRAAGDRSLSLFSLLFCGGRYTGITLPSFDRWCLL